MLPKLEGEYDIIQDIPFPWKYKFCICFDVSEKTKSILFRNEGTTTASRWFSRVQMTDTWGLTEEVVRRFHFIIVSVMKKLKSFLVSKTLLCCFHTFAQLTRELSYEHSRREIPYQRAAIYYSLFRVIWGWVGINHTFVANNDHSLFHFLRNKTER